MESLDSESLQNIQVNKVIRGQRGFPKGKSGNPGGRPRFITVMRERMASACADGVEFLHEVIKGKPIRCTIDGEELDVTPTIANRTEATALVMKYTLHQPKALTPEEMDAHDAGEVGGETKAVLTKLAAEEVAKYLKANGH